MKNHFLIIFLIFFVGSKSYAENICSSTSSTADTGTIYDSGGSGGNYSNYENCGFLIQPSSSPSTISLSFSQFSVDNSDDFLYVYDGTNTSGTLLGIFSGYSLPTTITATSGSLYLRFTSDYINNYSGFSASWTSANNSGSTTSCETVKDSFSSLSYSNNNGTQNWSNSWQEVGESDGTSAGKARVRNDLCSSGYCLRLGVPLGVSPSSYSNRGVARQVDLSNASSATLSFNYFKGVSSGSSSVTLSVSNNGGSSWTSLKTYTISSSHFSANPESFDISSYVSANTQVRFLSTGSSSSVTGMYIDDIEIEYCNAAVAELIASYNFDDDWVTNSSLTDQTGNYDGTPTGTVTQVPAGTSELKGDSCSAAAFGQGYIDISGLPVSTLPGAKTSVSFWMYWDGTNGVMPMGWNEHNLWIISGAFGFNTGTGDLTGISSSGLSPGWHHVAAVFTNGSVINNKLYIDGVQKTISSQRDGVPNLSRAIVQSTLRISGWVSSTGYPFSGGKLDNFKVYNGEMTQSQVTADMNETNACANTDTPAFAFNCVETGTNGISGKLYTKTTAQSFSYNVVALRDASTIEIDFADSADHAVTFELVDNSSGGSCSAYSALNPAVSQNIVFTAADAGVKTSVSMSSATAYSSVKCRVTDTTDSPSVVGCSSDSFSIRPTDFTITSNLTNTTDSGLPIAKAGENFTLIATAGTGYTGTPKIDTATLQAHSGAVNGNIGGSFNAAVAGIATGTNFTYSEVGSLRFTAEGIYDDTFTSVDPTTECTDDFSNTVVSEKVGCKFGNTATTSYFGRFTPDHFELSGQSLVNRNNLSCSPASNFTYTGEAFKTSFTLTAKNSNNATTQNYKGTLAKLDNSVISHFNFGAIDLADATTPLFATELNSSLNLVASSGAWINGVANITASLGLARTITNGPFESFNLGVAPADSDGIILASYDLDTSVPANSNDRSLLATTKIRFGRLNIDNAHGSELLPLPVNLYTEYYNGNSFITHTNDSCTPINISHLKFNSGSNPITVGSGTSTASIANSPLVQGKGDLSLTSPGVNNMDSIDISSTTILTTFPWLSYDWDSDGSNDNSPSARVTFGIYKGNKKLIYFREIY